MNQRLVDAENSSKSLQILKKELEDAKLSFEKKEEDYISTIKESKTNLEEVTMKLAEKESALLLPNSPNVSVLGNIIFKIFLPLWVNSFEFRMFLIGWLT